MPVTVPLPEVEVRVPPERASVAAERVNVDFARVPPETVSVALTVVLAARVAVPALTVRLLKGWVMFTIAAAVKTTVLVPAVKVALAAVTVQFPPTVIVEPFAVRVPLVPMVTEPAVMPRFDTEVVRMVFPVAPPTEFWTVRRPARVRAFVAIVYVMPAATLESKVTGPPNSVAEALKVIVRAAFEMKVMGAAKFHVADVVAFVQLPFVTVQEPVALEVMNAAAALMLTFPVSATVDVPVRRPPPTVSPPCAVRAKLVALVLRVPLTVRRPVTVRAAPRVLVPALWVMILKLCVAARVIDPVAPKTTVDVPLFQVAFAAVEVQLPLTVIVEAFAVSVPFVPIVMPPAVMARLPAPVVRTVFPVGPPTLFWIVRRPPQRRAFVAIVYVMPLPRLVSRTRLLNSFVAPARAAKVRLALAPSPMVTVLVPATHDADVDAFVHVPLTVQMDPPRFTMVVAVRMLTLPVAVTFEFRAKNVPWMLKRPLMVRAQLDPAAVSSVPVKPVMSMLAIVVAAARVVVPVAFASKIALSVAAGVQPQDAPPDAFDQFDVLFHEPPAPIR